MEPLKSLALMGEGCKKSSYDLFPPIVPWENTDVALAQGVQWCVTWGPLWYARDRLWVACHHLNVLRLDD